MSGFATYPVRAMRDEKKKALLPSGFADLLPPDAEVEAECIYTLMSCFQSFGYQRVKPPMVEFEESLFAEGPGAAMADQTFRVMDPLSLRMMGVRSDITPQVARIGQFVLGDEPRPLRLSYANDVLRTKAGQERIARQFCKVGCELIGDQNPEDQVEVIVMALLGLHRLGFNDVSVDLCFPRFLNYVMDHFSVPEDERQIISRAVAHRERSSFDPKDGLCAELIHALLENHDVAEMIAIIQGYDFGENCTQIISDLVQIKEGISRAIEELGLQGVGVTFDPFETKGFAYQDGIAFSFFSNAVRGELGRGGRYKICDHSHESAVGFTLYMDTVRSSIGPQEPQKIKTVSYDESWIKIKQYQEKGWVVTRSSQGE